MRKETDTKKTDKKRTTPPLICHIKKVLKNIEDHFFT